MKRAASSPPTTASAGDSSRTSRLPVAWLRMCSSSPMFSPWAASPKTSTGPRCVEHPRQPRPEVVAEEAQPLDRLVVADAEPQRPARALVQRRERAHAAPSSTTQTGIDGEQTPVIGPTWPCSLPGASVTSPRSQQRGRRLARGRPALEHDRRQQRPPLRVADAVPRDRRPRVQQHARRAAGHDRRPPARRSPPAARSPRSPRPRAALAAATAVAVPAPQRGSARSSIDASPPAGGRQSTCDDRRALVAQRVGERSSPRFTASTRVRTSARGVMHAPHWLNGRDGRSRRAGRAGPERARPARQARPRGRQRASTPASTATTPR